MRVEADTPVSEIFELLTQVYSLQTPGDLETFCLPFYFQYLFIDDGRISESYSTYRKVRPGHNTLLQYTMCLSGVILSVVGSLMGFTVSPKIEKIIQRGMIKAAITTNGWITTAGFNAG